jgi:serine/threonine protein phosphatase PrpC/predicted Ser/Thr protein kinase
MEGTPFGRYRLVELVGRGSMGEVWQAFDSVTERVVALKVLPAQYADDRKYQQRFRREARSAARLEDPHIVPIHDFGEIDGRLFVTMRLIKGSDLQAVINHGPLEPARAVGIIEQIASALHAAHRVGLIHRDVKPSNILVGDDDFAYLIDFGVARGADDTGLTSAGGAVGTLAYMAPERFHDGKADSHSDTYGLACVLYQALTGELPFPVKRIDQMVVAHMLQPPPRPSELQDAVPVEMDEVIATGLAKDPKARFPTVKDLARAARAALSSEGPTVVRPRPRLPGKTHVIRAETLVMRYTARSDRGLVHANNEDSVYAGARLLAVADGLTDGPAGELASQLVIAAMAQLDDDEKHGELQNRLNLAAFQGNSAIAAHVEANPELIGMGTTLTAILFAGNRLGLLHIGHSRGYLLRNGELSQITRDDTYVQTLVEEGRITDEEARKHPKRSLVMRSLTGHHVIPTLSLREVVAGDRYLLCTHGLSDPVDRASILAALQISDVELCADKLIELALRAGGADNVTVVVADVIPRPYGRASDENALTHV